MPGDLTTTFEAQRGHSQHQCDVQSSYDYLKRQQSLECLENIPRGALIAHEWEKRDERVRRNTRHRLRGCCSQALHDVRESHQRFTFLFATF